MHGSDPRSERRFRCRWRLPRIRPRRATSFLAGVLVLAVGGMLAMPAGPTLASSVYADWVAASSIPAVSNPMGNGVSCLSDGHCVAVGNDYSGGHGYDLVLHSADGGMTWMQASSVPAFSNPWLSDASCYSASDCVAVGSANSSMQVIRSSDSGATWSAASSLPSYSQPSVESVSCYGSGSCVAVGSYFSGNSNWNLVMTSSDGGQIWSAVTSVDASDNRWLSHVACDGSGACVAVGGTYSGPQILVSNDGGSSWSSPASTPSLSSVGLSGVDCFGSGDCIVVGDTSSRPFIMTSTDGGNTWSTASVPSIGTYGSAESVSCVPEGTTADCAAVGYQNGSNGNLVFTSSDGGNTWIEAASVAQPSAYYMLTGVSCYDATGCAAIGSMDMMGGLELVASQPTVSALRVSATSPNGDGTFRSGQPFTLTVTALDSSGAVAAGDNGTVTLSDGTGTISPTAVTLSGGTATVSATIARTSNSDTITATDTASSVQGTDAVAVVPYAVAVTDPSSATAGTPFEVTVQSETYSGTADDGFNGTVALSDATGTLAPSTLTLSAGTGTGTFTVMSIGADAVTARVDGAPDIAGTGATFTVSPGAAGSLTMATSTDSVGPGGRVTVSGAVYDTYGNPVANATVTLSAYGGTFGGQPSAVLTTGSDGGFSAVWAAPDQSGDVSISARSGAAQRSTTVNVTAGSSGGIDLVRAYFLLGPGTEADVAGTVYDTFGNVVPDATVTLTTYEGGAFAGGATSAALTADTLGNFATTWLAPTTTGLYTVNISSGSASTDAVMDVATIRASVPPPLPPPPPPSVDGVSPTSGVAGTMVRLTGDHLVGATTVDFGGVPAPWFMVLSEHSAKAEVPDGSGTVGVTVTTAGGTSTVTAADAYTYVAAPHFTDVPAGSPLELALQTLAPYNAVSGFPSSPLFLPDAPATQAQFVKMLVLTLSGAPGPDADTAAAQTFGGLPPNAWYLPYLGEAVTENDLSGWRGSSFDPNAPLTRQTLALLLMNAEHLSVPSTPYPISDPSSVDAWAKNAVSAVLASGLMTTDGSGDFNPNAAVSRADAVELLARLV